MPVDPRDAQRRMENAGDIIEQRVKAAAAGFSRRIPAATRRDQVGPNANEVTVSTDNLAAPNAAPFEFAEHHPLFGNHRHMYRQPKRPYAARGLEAAADAAVEETARMVDDWAEDLGFTEE
jgi:hypothetical protein